MPPVELIMLAPHAFARTTYEKSRIGHCLYLLSSNQSLRRVVQEDRQVSPKQLIS